MQRSAAITADEISVQIVAQLRSIETTHDVRVLFACESGSRAWGFASTNSDYDVRFLYVHPRDWYLSVADRRDVIEHPIADDLDISGWELRKALRLLRKSNPPLLEWLRSPTIYLETGATADRMRELAARQFSPIACYHHYLSMARTNHRRYLKGDRIPTKRYLYVLRPLLAVQWLEQGYGLVPTEFQSLLETLVPRGPLRDALDKVVDRKRGGKVPLVVLDDRKRAGQELDEGPTIPELDTFISAEFQRHADSAGQPKQPPIPFDQLDSIFRASLRE